MASKSDQAMAAYYNQMAYQANNPRTAGTRAAPKKTTPAIPKPLPAVPQTPGFGFGMGLTPEQMGIGGTGLYPENTFTVGMGLTPEQMGVGGPQLGLTPPVDAGQAMADYFLSVNSPAPIQTAPQVQRPAAPQAPSIAGQAMADYYLQANQQANNPRYAPAPTRSNGAILPRLLELTGGSKPIPPPPIQPPPQPQIPQPQTPQTPPSSIGGLMAGVMNPDLPQLQPGGLMDFNQLAYNMAQPQAQMPYSPEMMSIFNRGLPASTAGTGGLLGRFTDHLTTTQGAK